MTVKARIAALKGKPFADIGDDLQAIDKVMRKASAPEKIAYNEGVFAGAAAVYHYALAIRNERLMRDLPGIVGPHGVPEPKMPPCGLTDAFAAVGPETFARITEETAP